MFLPLQRNLSTSPQPHTLDFVVSLHSVHAQHAESVLPEVVQVPEESVLQVASEIVHSAFVLVSHVVGLPNRPTSLIKLLPEALQAAHSIRSVAELSFPVIQVEGRLRQGVQGVRLLLLHVSLLLFLIRVFLLLRLLFLWFRLLLCCLLLFRLVLFCLLRFLFVFLFSIIKQRHELFLAQPKFAKVFCEFLQLTDVDDPFCQIWEGASDFLIEGQSEDIPQIARQRNIGDRDFVSTQKFLVFEVRIGNFQYSDDFFFGILISLFFSWGITKYLIQDFSQGATDLEIDVFKPLIDGGGFEGRVSVEVSGLPGNVSHDGMGLKDASFGSLKGGNFAKGVLLEVFRGLPFGTGEPDSLNLEVGETKEDFYFGSCAEDRLRRVKFHGC